MGLVVPDDNYRSIVDKIGRRMLLADLSLVLV